MLKKSASLAFSSILRGCSSLVRSLQAIEVLLCEIVFLQLARRQRAKYRVVLLSYGEVLSDATTRVKGIFTNQDTARATLH